MRQGQLDESSMMPMRIESKYASRVHYLFSAAFISHVVDIVQFIWTHPSNQRRRARAIFRFANFQVRGRILRQSTLVPLGQRSKIIASLHRQAVSKAVCGNPPDYAEMLIWRQVLKPGDLFVDVGANVGSYTIWAGDLGAEVIALEPAKDTYKLLIENVALNGYPVQTICAAAGASAGKARFTIGRDALNRLDPVGSTEIEMLTIDSVIADRKVAGMKVDVEGFEIEVLRGCERALADQRLRLIQLEWNASSTEAVGTDRKPLADLLAKHGYSLYRPNSEGILIPLTDISFGPDVFARPALDK
jgi:FkbM family methyltransferase